MEWFKRLFSTLEWRVLGYSPTKQLVKTNAYTKKKYEITGRYYVVEDQFGVRKYKGEVIFYPEGCDVEPYIDEPSFVKYFTTQFQRKVINEWSVSKFNEVFGSNLKEYKDAMTEEEFLENVTGPIGVEK